MNVGTRIEELLSDLKKASDLYKDMCESAFVNTIPDIIKDVKGLRHFVIYGYTPSFNDGEPCEHSSNTIVLDSDKILTKCRENYSKYKETWFDDIYEGIGTSYFNSVFGTDYCFEENVEDIEKFFALYGNSTSNEDREYVVSLFGSPSIEQAMESAFNTNWVIFFYRENENDDFTMVVKDFECGY